MATWTEAGTLSQDLLEVIESIRQRPGLLEHLLTLPSRRERFDCLHDLGIVSGPYRSKAAGTKTPAEELVPPGYIATPDGYLVPMGDLLAVATCAL